jgi:hypothetical protein
MLSLAFLHLFLIDFRGTNHFFVVEHEVHMQERRMVCGLIFLGVGREREREREKMVTKNPVKTMQNKRQVTIDPHKKKRQSIIHALK